MKTYIPTITVIVALTCSIGSAQTPTAAESAATPAPPAVATLPQAVTVYASSGDEAAAVTEDALAVQSQNLDNANDLIWRLGDSSGRATTSTRSLVIPRDAGEGKSISETEEDMSVMARILEKAARGKPQKHEGHPTGYAFAFGSSGSSPRNLYIDGYGAVFFMSVNFPLVPPDTKEKSSEPKPETDTEWEKTKNEMYHPHDTSSGFGYNVELFDSGNPFGSTGSAEEYDEEKVTELKESLSAALKNAGHIRRLKGDDTVTIVVTGRGAGSGPRAATIRRSQNSSSSSSSGSATTWVTAPRAASHVPTTRLVIRAKRSDIESFQKDKLSADDFRKKVTMFTY